MTPDAAAKLWDDNINRRLFDLMHSQNTTEIFGGLLAIGASLANLVPATPLGQIAHIGSSAFGGRFMDYEVPAAIELMQPEKQESLRYAGVLILKELTRNSPGYFHSHISFVFENIIVALRDQRVIVREGTAKLLAACLEIVIQRECQSPNTYLNGILTEAQAGLKMPQPEIIHGSLLMYSELLLHAGMVHSLVRGQVIVMIPSLAAYDTQTFKDNYLR
ncbi:uncharacterized protein EV420DRAFT_1585633 [Desarmillaria tabescens]|uniref:ARM repeat-containing protein n=1 Tax=Armillaria tabescens TaxID=1929756 RepID=A0AA39MLC3_ARMTA|nr:uncharacterized protein EV420DRAFT_1585633 [Desarmillaria tabescens]KAK0438497.1 hypothetical protein EV420DRAFT_1585633 [Desarmillaria tabescens]